MYVPSHFDESRPDVLHDLIENIALGMLITNCRSGLIANHLPFDLNRSKSSMAFCTVTWRATMSSGEVHHLASTGVQ
jgi:predicted FMN-binding regulatory protein PaiB